MEFVILGILSVISLALIYILTSTKLRGKTLSSAAVEARNEFDKFSSPERECSDTELASYITKYKPLIEDIEKFQQSFFVSKSQFSKLCLDNFLIFFERIGEIHKENNDLYHTITEINLWLKNINTSFQLPFESYHYFTFSEKELFLFENRKYIADFNKLYPKYKQYFNPSLAEKISQELNTLEVNRQKHNDGVVKLILNENKDYFDTILPYPLDSQQREAIATLEDNTLVISSAGSGKTSTIIGKAKFLLDKVNINPRKLLILTYTRKAASELEERLGNTDVDCSTFHSLAVRILGKLENKKPSICEPALLLNVFRHLIKTNPEFKKGVLNYILRLQSRMKLEHEYEKAPDYFADRKKYGIQAPYPDARGNIIFTKSEEEKRICTFLTELGVDFLYEEPYEIDTFTEDYRQYKPDFTILVPQNYINPATGQKQTQFRRVYLEHFAVDAEGRVPKWFGDKDPIGGWFSENRKYKEGIRWKRYTHSKNNTTLIETKSADFHSGRIFEVLKERLRNANVPMHKVSENELYERLVKRSQRIESSVFKLLEQFIALFKSNCNTDINALIEIAKTTFDKRTYIILNDIIKPLITEYEKVLKQRGEIDYTDAILLATKYCAEGYWHQYDYILVDEFQDISVDRYQFLNALRKHEPLTKLFCVGDDWQSIYRFAGSNMQLFYKFEQYFGFTVSKKIEKTYRLFNPLLQISSEFIQRNPEQLKKDVLANLTANNASTSIEFHDCGDSNLPNTILLKTIELISKIPQNENILILGRYNYDVRSLGYNTDLHDFDRNRDKIELNIAGRHVRFMSVHSAKGLEADNVILINCNEGMYGFPSLIEDDPILSYLLSEGEQYENAEERRLFYVALTRARKHLHILYNKDKPSPFVREITNVLKKEDYFCPVCREGHVVKLKDGLASNGNKYTTYGCSNADAGCDYFERVFGKDKPTFLIFNEFYKNNKKHRY